MNGTIIMQQNAKRYGSFAEEQPGTSFAPGSLICVQFYEFMTNRLLYCNGLQEVCAQLGVKFMPSLPVLLAVIKRNCLYIFFSFNLSGMGGFLKKDKCRTTSVSLTVRVQFRKS